MEPLVSISCITYNHEKYIRDALDSFLMQKTSFKYEILIHDDASTDATQDIIREYQKKHPDIIKPYIQNENQYSRGVRRLAIKYNVSRARGKFIAICEGDDFWTDPYKLQKQIDLMNSNPKCSMSCHSADKVFNDKSLIGEVRPYKRNKIITPEEMILGGGGFIATNSMIYRKELLDNPPEFLWNAPVGDYALQIYFTEIGECFYIDTSMSAYRKATEGSWSSKLSQGKKSKEFIAKHLANTVETLISFNEYTNMRYETTINLKSEKLEFQIKCIKRDKSVLKSQYFWQLSMKRKFKSLGMIFFPSLIEIGRSWRRGF